MEAVEIARAEPKKRNLTRPLVMALLVSCLGSVQYGYNLWIINNPKVVKLDFYNKTRYDGGIADIHQRILRALMTIGVALFPFGGVLGSFLIARLVDSCGRRRALLVNNCLSIAASTLMGCAHIVNSYEFSMFARFVIGVCSGVFSGAVPMYLFEIAPVNLRGAILAMATFFVNVGIMVGQVLGFSAVLGNTKGWAILMSFTGMLALFHIFLLLSFPESPRFLLIQKRDEDYARKVLKKLRDRDDVEEEMEQLRQEDLAEKEEKHMNFVKLLQLQNLKWQVLSITILMLGQQFAGGSVVLFYIEGICAVIWRDKATGKEDGCFKVLTIGFVCSMLVAFILMVFVIDVLGRKVLLLVGFGICAFSCILLTIAIELQVTMSWMAYISAVVTFIFFTGFIIGPKSIPSLITAELFLQSSRASAYVVASCVQWLCKFIFALAFDTVQKGIGAYIFLICLPFCLATFYYILKYIPETKNKTFLDIRRQVEIHRAKSKWGKQLQVK